MIDVAARLSETMSQSFPAHLTPSPRAGAPMLPVSPTLAAVLPDGLRRGNTVTVSGSVSLLLAVIAAASADGAWCAMVGMPAISAEAARDLGVELSRFPMVPAPGSQWVVVVAALLDAMDVVVAQVPPRLAAGDIRRLVARARSRGAVFVPFSRGAARWPHADIRLSADVGSWSGIGCGYGRLRQRRTTVTASGRGQAARTRSTTLWLPTAAGGVEPYVTQPLAPVSPDTSAPLLVSVQ
jgi:hypothetical protein